MKKTLGVFLITLGVLMILFATLFVVAFCIARYRGLDQENHTVKFYMLQFGISIILLTTGYLLLGVGMETMKGKLTGTHFKSKIWGITLLFLGLMLQVSVIANFKTTNLSVIAAHVFALIISVVVIYTGVKKIKTSTHARPRL